MHRLDLICINRNFTPLYFMLNDLNTNCDTVLLFEYNTDSLESAAAPELERNCAVAGIPFQPQHKRRVETALEYK